MLFTSPTFIYLFLPILLALYFLVPRAMKNALLLVASLIFYTWGEIPYAWVFLLSIAINYFLGLLIDSYRLEKSGPWLLTFACTVNLSLLAYFKYYNFIVSNIHAALGLTGLIDSSASPLHLDAVHLPVGISFFTFHALSYLIDVSRGASKAQKKPWDLALYLALFPQLIAGPIIRYHDIADQIESRNLSLDNIYHGLRRFIFGLAKKLLIANTLGMVADDIFAIPSNELTSPLAWLGITSYSLQLYFDFSAYSCMAIGLGRVFGFHFLENFNYPYSARSVQDFWRRWHISLSRWFRDYLYIPLGGNRHGAARTYTNLCIVFFLCGLWHGASWNFVVWGLFHGAFLCLERTSFGNIIIKLWPPLAHTYTLLLIIIAWVFFRSNTLPDAINFLKAMAGFGQSLNPHYNAEFYFNNEFILVFVLSTIFSLPLWPRIESLLEKNYPARIHFYVNSSTYP